MAKYNLELPTELMQLFKNLDANTEKMIGEMCQAGAEVVKENTFLNMPNGLKDAISVGDNLITSRIYKTPSDGGINVQCMIVGYFTNEDGQRGAILALVRSFSETTLVISYEAEELASGLRVQMTLRKEE